MIDWTNFFVYFGLTLFGMAFWGVVLSLIF